MEVNKRTSETYIITDVPSLDPITVYVTNYTKGRGKIVIESFGEAWTCYWDDMGGRTVEEFVLSCDNDYMLRKMVDNTHETDFDAINDEAEKQGVQLCVYDDVELYEDSDLMEQVYGDGWYMVIPQCHTNEYQYLSKILTVIKQAFKLEN